MIAANLLLRTYYFLLSKHNFKSCEVLDLINTVLLVVSLIVLFISLIFVAKSYNNVFLGFNYLKFPATKELRDYQIKLDKYNSEVDEDKRKDFKDYIIGKFVEYSDNHSTINIKRSLELYRAKTLIVITIFLNFMAVCIYLLKTFVL